MQKSLRTCVICSKPENPRLRSHPEIPRCKIHADYTHWRVCGCGKAQYIKRQNKQQKTCISCSKQQRKEQRKEERLEQLKERFLRYLSATRTLKEMESRFADPKALLKESYEGYSLYQQRNNYNEPTWILLPVVDNTIEVQPRDWAYHIGKDQHGVPDPYIMVQLPDAWVDHRIRIVPLFDVHFGHSAHRAEKFLSYLRWIEETPEIYVILGGDILENALDDGRGMSYEQALNPQSQLAEGERLLSRIAHKILLATPGNHEWRTYKKSGIDPLRFLCSRLDIPYFEGPVFLSLLAGGYEWFFYVFHGRSNAQTKGGKLNAAQMAKRFTGMVHFFLSGHTHDPQVNPETCIIKDPENCCLRYATQWTVVAQSFLGWKGTYAYRAGYPPPGQGGVSIEIFDNGDYSAALK